MTLIQALINSESASDMQEALQIKEEMKQAVLEGADPEDVLFEYGLEPDYVLELLDFELF